jgi:tRNA-binding protein
MLIASYNPSQMGDILVVILGEDVENQAEIEKNDVVKIFDSETNKTLGFNFLNVSKFLPHIAELNGQIKLSQQDIDTLNKVLTDNDLKAEISADNDPKFLVGYVKSVKPHPKSDHLKITETVVNNDEVLQIVSSSPNMQEDIKVVVAKVGAMMPSGLIIWPGELKGEASNGMICSGRELKIPNAPQKPGALILPDSFKVGDAFDASKASDLFE